MDLSINCRNMELNEKTREDIGRKMNRLARHLPGITAGVVELSRHNARSQDSRVVAQVTVDIGGTVLRAEELGANVTAAVNQVISVMDRRVERYKGKVYKSMQARKTGRSPSQKARQPNDEVADDVPAADEITDAAGQVVRVKRFPIKPMAMDEAAFNMELLGHNFYLFVDGETEQYNVLYRRRDGAYGLIQPEPL